MIHKIDSRPVSVSRFDHCNFGLPFESDRAADPQEIVENVHERMWVEAHDLGGRGHSRGDRSDRRQVNRTNVAEVLSQNDVGLERDE